MKDLKHPSSWKYSSSIDEGFFEVVTPENSACKLTWVFRLNLKKGKSYSLSDKKLELNGVVIKGSVSIRHSSGERGLDKFDSFYLPAKDQLTIMAKDDCSLFFGGSLYERRGEYFVREYDLSIPLGGIHQIHGTPPFSREVFMTVSEKDVASRLICGITVGEPGAWTSWPPHQHTLDLEEAYCYFDIPDRSSVLHCCSRQPGKIEFVHPASAGDCVIVPEGYHPTVGIPGVKSCYFWVMAAHSSQSRRYDLAVNDPIY
ncbi:5-deoxy-glucuronate isomerase [Mariniphaga anaerophila]|uniref:5-deoxy-glucuronate isomerase n=1 Tax=Mariniphaga anaerophila TaxID=1484053 RepID=A0A1M5G328_9BACT|nr:5-deoxy-glucuronate isomerase [Mariniphaga anaerophila]SHF97861.1 5-deoxy-glucuronate isomerase [Mariniphaga anaerophila]